jgi:hypothetical protein
VSNQDLARVRVGQVSDLGSDLSSELVITVTFWFSVVLTRVEGLREGLRIS